ncbi:MAG: nitrate- and nitrite sensing domain-containing protein, partial [Opitutales bacterium]
MSLPRQLAVLVLGSLIFTAAFSAIIIHRSHSRLASLSALEGGIRLVEALSALKQGITLESENLHHWDTEYETFDEALLPAHAAELREHWEVTDHALARYRNLMQATSFGPSAARFLERIAHLEELLQKLPEVRRHFGLKGAGDNVFVDQFRQYYAGLNDRLGEVAPALIDLNEDELLGRKLIALTQFQDFQKEAMGLGGLLYWRTQIDQYPAGGVHDFVSSNKQQARLRQFVLNIAPTEWRGQIATFLETSAFATYDAFVRETAENLRNGQHTAVSFTTETVDPVYLEIRQGFITLVDRFQGDLLESTLAHLAAARRERLLAVFGATIAILGTLLLGMGVGRNVKRALEEVIEGLKAGTRSLHEVVRVAAHSARESAHNASSQAAAIEETTASLEETNEQINRNAEGAHRAGELISRTMGAIGSAEEVMSQL